MEQTQIEHAARLIPYLVLFSAAAAVSLTLLCIRSFIIGWQLERFIKDTQAQLTGFLDKHAHWTDVATLALQTGPSLLQGAVQLALSLQELSFMVNKAGGLAKMIDTAADNNRKLKQEASAVAQSRTRKPRIVKPAQAELEDYQQ